MPAPAPYEFTFIHPKEYKKIAIIFGLMCALAHVRRKEMQKRWLSKGQTPGLMDHPVVPYVIENGTLFGMAYLLSRFMPKPVQDQPLRTFLQGIVSTLFVVEPLIAFSKFAAVYLYPHVPYFTQNKPEPSDTWTQVREFLTNNIPVELFNNAVVTALVYFMPAQDFSEIVQRPKPLELMPFLAKYAFCRIVTDLVFYVAHRVMHDFPSVYNAVHKRHHEHQNPRTGTNFHFNVVDFFVEAVLPFQVAVAGLVAIGQQPNQLEQMAILIPLTYFESASHTGKEIPTVTWFPPLSPLVNYLTGSDERLVEFHTRHHQLYRCNYSISPWVDKLLGTYRIDLPEHYANNKMNVGE